MVWRPEESTLERNAEPSDPLQSTCASPFAPTETSAGIAPVPAAKWNASSEPLDPKISSPVRPSPFVHSTRLFPSRPSAIATALHAPNGPSGDVTEGLPVRGSVRTESLPASQERR